MVVLALLPALTIVGLLVATIWQSFNVRIFDAAPTLRNYVDLYADSFAYRAFLNSLMFSACTLVVAFLFGLPIAWIAERTDTRGRSVIQALMSIGLFVPGFITAMGWLFLLNPRIGLVNAGLKALFGPDVTPVNIVSVAGMGIVQGLALAPVVFVFTSASLRSMDPQLEEAARMSGAGFMATLRRVVGPIAWPGLLASGLYVFTIGLSAFDVPLVIGLSNRIYTFSTFLFVMSTANPDGVPRYGLIAAFASLMIVLALLLSWWYSRVLVQSRKYQVVTGKGYRPRLISLGKWAFATWAIVILYLLVANIMPVLVMIWASLLPYFQPFSTRAFALLSFATYQNLNWPLLLRAFENTAVLMLTVPLIALVMSLVSSWVVLRSRNRFRLAFDFIAFMPHAVPTAILAFSALVIILQLPRGSQGLLGSLIPIIAVMAIAMLSFGSRITNGALIQIHADLEEAAQMSGVSNFEVLRRIVFPLMKPALLFGWLWIALLAFRELTIPAMLFSPKSIPLSVAIWSLFSSGDIPGAAATSLIMLVLLFPLIVAYMRYAGKSGIAS
jgi:iron(III) transport system permease protein